MMENFKKLVQVFTLFALAYGLAACFAYHCYYTCFGIDIFKYIGYTDILLSFSSNIYYVIVLLGGACCMVGVIRLFKKKTVSAGAEKFTKWQIAAFYPMLFMVLLVVVWLMFSLTKWPFLDIIFAFCFSMIFLAVVYLTTWERKEFPVLLSIISYAGLLVTIMFFAEAVARKRIQKGNWERDISFTYGSQRIYSDACFFPIGEEKEHFFFYDKKNGTTTRFEKGKIDSVVFKARRNDILNSYLFLRD